jgi:aspartyl-tRNA synthetase
MMYHTTPFRMTHSIVPDSGIDFYGIDVKQCYGDYRDIASEHENNRSFVDIDTLQRNSDMTGKRVWTRGRISKIRSKGKACFVVVRSKAMYTVQACCFKEKNAPEQSLALIDFISSIPLESIVDIYGEVVPADVHTCSQNDIEIAIEKVYVVSRAPVVLPFLLDDASRLASTSPVPCS